MGADHCVVVNRQNTTKLPLRPTSAYTWQARRLTGSCYPTAFRGPELYSVCLIITVPAIENESGSSYSNGPMEAISTPMCGSFTP